MLLLEFPFIFKTESGRLNCFCRGLDQERIKGVEDSDKGTEEFFSTLRGAPLLWYNEHT